MILIRYRESRQSLDPIHLFLFESGAGEAEAMTSIAVLSNCIKENTFL